MKQKQLISLFQKTKIKIRSISRSDWFDESDATFTIADTAILNFDMGFEAGESLAGWEFEGAFTVDSFDAFEGNKSAKCTNGYGTLSKTVTVNSGVLRFFAKSNETYSSFRFKIDGQQMITGIDLDVEWQLVEIFVGAGTYNFEWDWLTTSSTRTTKRDNKRS